MKAFKLIVNLDVLSTEDVLLGEEYGDKSDKKSTHSLSEQEKRRLDTVIGMFPSFADKGLGKIHLEVHVIDTGNSEAIKQRHYPVSPAVQKRMYAGLDRLLG